MNRVPETGDIIMVPGSRAEHLVVDQYCDGDHCFFDYVSTKSDPITGEINGDKPKRYWVRKDGTDISSIKDIRLINTAKFKKTVSISYKITKIKDV